MKRIRFFVSILVILLSILIFTINSMRFNSIGSFLRDEIKTLRIGISEDTYIYEADPTKNYSGQSIVYVGATTTNQRHRAYFDYNIYDLIDLHIVSANVISAELIVHQRSATTTNPTATTSIIYEIRRPLQDWNAKTINWNTQPANAVDGLAQLDDQNGSKALDITEHIKLELNHPQYAYGVSLAVKTPADKLIGFYSRDCHQNEQSCPNEIEEPYIIIKYYENRVPSIPIQLTPLNDTATTSMKVDFSWSNGSDPENEAVFSILEITNNMDFAEPLYSQQFNSGIQVVHVQLDDGDYIWRVKNCDYPEHCSESQIRGLIVDTRPPNPPVIQPTPPYVFGTQANILWDFADIYETKPVIFEVQLSRDSSFTNTVTTMQTEFLNVVFKNLEERVYFSRVRAIDIVNNVSEWSETVSFEMLNSAPIINSLTTSESAISPYSSPGIKDHTSISFSISAHLSNHWTLIFEDKDRRILLKLTGDLQKERFIYPNFTLESGESLTNCTESINSTCIEYIDEQLQTYEGYIFAYLVAENGVGLTGKSNIISILVDNTIPRQPIITYPTENSTINTRSPKAKVRSDNFLKNEIRLNDSLIATSSLSEISVILPTNITREGGNQIRIISTDEAGNYSIKEIFFYIDTTPPSKPYVETNFNATPPEISVLNTDYLKAYLYINNTLSSQIDYPEKTFKIYHYDKLKPNSSAYVITADLVDNKSKKSELINLPYSNQKDNRNLTTEIGEDQTEANQTSNQTDMSEVLGIGSAGEGYNPPVNQSVINSCTFTYNLTKKTFTSEKCDIYKPSNKTVRNEQQSSSSYTVAFNGIFPYSTNIELKLVQCKQRTVFDPRTWFSCFEEHHKTIAKAITAGGTLYAFDNNTRYEPGYRSITNNSIYDIRIYPKADLYNHKISITSSVFFSANLFSDIWIDFIGKSPDSDAITIPKAVANQNSSKGSMIFRFPFGQVVHVTQWHGYTKYAKPHKGIDFASYRLPIYAMADGTVSAVGWDNYYGECNSGGNYIKIKHNNGMHTFFAHLENYKNSKGVKYKIGDKVKKGDLIGLTGNTGKWGCEPLGYHLHFELRKSSSQSSHLNPVPYIDTDWSKIKTAQADKYPGRLTGDNPHPKY